MLTKPGRTQDLRVRRTRHLLQQEFWKLLEEKSFQSITVQDITERAMVNRATFYDHFADKYALLQFSISEWFKETLQSRLPEDFKGSPQNLQHVILTACEFLSRLRRHCLPRDAQILPLVQTTITESMARILLEWIREARTDKPANGVSPELAATVASWAIYGAAFHWSQQERQEPAEAFSLRVLPIITASLGRHASFANP